MKFSKFIGMACFTAFAMAAGSVSASAQKPEDLVKVTFSPNWNAQSQYAGYYVAKEKGFFRAEGLDVDIVHLPVTSSADLTEELAAGKVDIINIHLVTAMVQRASGKRLVNILQTSQNSSLMFVSHVPVKSVFNNHRCRIAVWKNCSEVASMVINDMMKGCTVVPILQSISVFYSGAVDAVTATSYNEYYKIMQAEGIVPEENVFRCSGSVYNYPEDGLYVTESYYEKHKKDVAAFCRAVKKGWDYTREHPDEALDMVRIYTDRDNIRTNGYHQSKMLEEVLRLQVNPATGNADYAPVSEERFDEIVLKMYNQKLIPCQITYRDFIR